jgi:hypothetical protein
MRADSTGAGLSPPRHFAVDASFDFYGTAKFRMMWLQQIFPRKGKLQMFPW